MKNLLSSSKSVIVSVRRPSSSRFVEKNGKAERENSTIDHPDIRGLGTADQWTRRELASLFRRESAERLPRRFRPRILRTSMYHPAPRPSVSSPTVFLRSAVHRSRCLTHHCAPNESCKLTSNGCGGDLWWAIRVQKPPVFSVQTFPRPDQRMRQYPVRPLCGPSIAFSRGRCSIVHATMLQSGVS